MFRCVTNAIICKIGSLIVIKSDVTHLQLLEFGIEGVGETLESNSLSFRSTFNACQALHIHLQQISQTRENRQKFIDLLSEIHRWCLLTPLAKS